MPKVTRYMRKMGHAACLLQKPDSKYLTMLDFSYRGKDIEDLYFFFSDYH